MNHDETPTELPMFLNSPTDFHAIDHARQNPIELGDSWATRQPFKRRMSSSGWRGLRSSGILR